MKKVISLLNIVLVLSLLVAGCAAPTPEVIEKEVIVEKEVPVTVVVEKEVAVEKEVPAPAKAKIGVLIPLTGALSEFGENFRLVRDLVAKHFEEAGFPIELITVDTETSAIPGVEAARTLVDVEKVHVLIGAAAGGVTIPIAESVSIPSEVPQISYSSTSPLITVLPADEGKDFLFRSCFSDALQGIIAGELAADLGYKTASVIWVNNPYGEGLAEKFTESFEFHGGQVIASVPHDAAVAPTYKAELTKAMEGEPEVLFCVSYPDHATIYLKEFIEAGYNKFCNLLFCDGTKSSEMPAEVGPEYLAGFFGTAPGTAMGDGYNTFVEEYTKVYGVAPPLPFMDCMYDAIVVAGLAAAKCEADGVDITPVNLRDRLREVACPPGETVIAGAESLKKALDLLKAGEAINYEGTAGSVDFDEAGDVITFVEIWRYVEEPPYIGAVVEPVSWICKCDYPGTTGKGCRLEYTNDCDYAGKKPTRMWCAAESGYHCCLCCGHCPW